MIHDKKFFEADELRKRARDNGFSQPLFVELLAWDYELAAQLQKEDAGFVLKGGAAVQLYLPLEVQRVSVDVDMLSPASADTERIFRRVEEKLAGVEFKRYAPKKPAVNLPMLTYLASVPSAFSEKRNEVKIDVLMEDLKLPVTSLKDVETIALTVQKMKCLSFGTILGDKLQILADAKITGYKKFPKHVYDISALIDSPHLTEETLQESKEALEKIIPTECKYKRAECDVKTALQETVQALEHYSRADLRIGAGEMKRDMRNFTQVYAPARERASLWEWSCKALKIKFFTSVMLRLIEKEISKNRAYDLLKRALATERKLASTNASETRPELMKLFTERHPGYKEIRNAPLPRLYWQVITTENLNEITALAANSEDAM